ncbi:MAG: hypothetical protein CFH19_00593 [Alphaproteobacteria bacterium MarineAlpha5_Bin9]|mgnify:CR=1 FL=1|nr:MAG: hypothetical protein CFH19_00593 [Alphaproteobacteria bacterium MarineAlpha5_Bin9]|tara:strand:- start:6771 stop:7346 length:576 start_codon:yes stop_codon:yes gene_type:complete
MLKKEETVLFKKHNIENYSKIKIEEIQNIKKINLRFDPNSKELKSITSKILDIIIPTIPNTYSEKEKQKIIWLGPNEWLIIDSEEKLDDDLLNKSLGDENASVTNISESKTILRISGKKTFSLLSKFLVLDLEKNLSNDHLCVQTIFLKVPILLVRNKNFDNIIEIDIFINRSHVNYIYNILIDGTKNLDF